MSTKNIAIALIAIVVVIAAVAALVMPNNGGGDRVEDAIGTYTLYDYSSAVMDGQDGAYWEKSPGESVFKVLSVENGIATIEWDGVRMVGTIDYNKDIKFLNTYEVDGMMYTDLGDARYENGTLIVSVTSSTMDGWFEEGACSVIRASFVKEGSSAVPRAYDSMFEEGDTARSFAVYYNEQGIRSDAYTSYEFEVLSTNGLVSSINAIEHGDYTSYRYNMLLTQMDGEYGRALVIDDTFGYSFVCEVHRNGNAIVINEWASGDYGNTTLMASTDGKVHPVKDVPNISGKIFTGTRYYAGSDIEGVDSSTSFLAFGNYGDYTADVYNYISSTGASFIPSAYGYAFFFQCPGWNGEGKVYGYGLVSFDLRTLDVSMVGFDADGETYASCERLEAHDSTGPDDIVGVYYGTTEMSAYSYSKQVSERSRSAIYSALVIASEDDGIIKGSYNYIPFAGTYDGDTVAFSSTYFDTGDVLAKVYGDRIMLNEHYLDGKMVFSQNRGYVKLTDSNTDGKGHFCEDVPYPEENTIAVGTVLTAPYGLSVTTYGTEIIDGISLECVLSDGGIYSFDMRTDGGSTVRVMGLQLTEHRIEIMGNSGNGLVTYSLTRGADEDFYTLVRSAELLGNEWYSALSVYYLTEDGSIPEIDEIKDISGSYSATYDIVVIAVENFVDVFPEEPAEVSIKTVDGTHGHVVVIDGLGDDPLIGYLRYEGDDMVLASSVHMFQGGVRPYYADLFATIDGDSFDICGAGNGDVRGESMGLVIHITRA